MKGYIYAIINLKTNKTYIGQTKYINKRFNEHKKSLRGNRHSNRYLQSSWNKYNEENFIFEMILDDVSYEDLNKMETMFIKLFESNNGDYGYNLTIGGDGVQGYKHTSENILKMTASHNYPNGENHHFYGKKQTEESIEKIKFHAQGENNGMFGKKHSEETKLKISEKMKNVNKNRQLKKKVSPELVVYIKNMFSQGFTIKMITDKLGIPQTTLSKIKNNKY